ncbi:hypothetical protein NDU88_002817 [Pleurodeles waltl]|uniref:Uncharacterized protein n=1 Tax=Pleurodeles waltl TaxID=8319 RepID=A0AAV7W387_PLEWA|nr:hypothetical protein NDU88_002817 [Pleurodeles waltl]
MQAAPQSREDREVKWDLQEVCNHSLARHARPQIKGSRAVNDPHPLETRSKRGGTGNQCGGRSPMAVTGPPAMTIRGWAPSSSPLPNEGDGYELQRSGEEAPTLQMTVQLGGDPADGTTCMAWCLGEDRDYVVLVGKRWSLTCSLEEPAVPGMHWMCCDTQHRPGQ